MKTKAQRSIEAKERRAEYEALSIDEKIRRAEAARGLSKRQLDRLYAQRAKKRDRSDDSVS